MLALLFHLFLAVSSSYSPSVSLPRIIAEPTTRYCTVGIKNGHQIKIRLEGGRFINLLVVPGQKSRKEELQSKIDSGEINVSLVDNFVHFVKLKDLLPSLDSDAAIAFNTHNGIEPSVFLPNYAVIFSPRFPNGISRDEFLNTEKDAEPALEQFLQLFNLFTAALDSCRPESMLSYATSNELDRIINGRLRFFKIAQKLNSGFRFPIHYERLGVKGGFIDPNASVDTGYGFILDFKYLNPLNFSIDQFTPAARGELPKAICAGLVQKITEEYISKHRNPDKLLLHEYISSKSFGRCRSYLEANWSDKKLGQPNPSFGKISR